MKLTNKNIATAIEDIEKFFDTVKASKKDKLKICLILEETLLRYQEKFGEDCEFKIVTRKWLGAPKVSIKIKGKPYNPLEDNDSDENILPESIIENLLNYEQAGVNHSYEKGCNEIKAFSTREVSRLKILGDPTTISIFVGIIAALIVENFSEPTQKIIVEDITTPLLNSLFGTIVAANIPLVFISIVSSICALENVTVLNELGTKTLKRFAKIVLFIAFLTICISCIFFQIVNLNFGGQALADNSKELYQIFNLILSIIPQNVIEPFLNAQILQIVVIALITGICITILGDRVNEFKNLILNLKQIIFKVVEFVMKVIPLVIFLCIFKTILVYDIGEIFGVWKLIAANYAAFFLVTFVFLLKNSIKHGVKIWDFLKKIYPALLITFTTGSGSAAIPKNIELCKSELKIKENLCDFYIPLSHALCPTTILIGIIIYTFYAAEFSSLQISISQLFIIAFLSVQFSLSAVAENGGIIAFMSLMIAQMGFSMDCLGMIMTANIFVVNISGVIGIVVRDCDLYDFDKKLSVN